LTKTKLIISVVVLIVLLLFAYVLINTYLLHETKYLAYKPDERYTNNLDEQSVLFFDGADVDPLVIASIRMDPKYDYSNNLLVSIWHQEGIDLDDLTLTFTNMRTSQQNWPTILNELTNSYAWPTMMKFGTTNDGSGQIFELPDMGFAGKGTVTMRFQIQTNMDEDLSNFYCHIDLQLSKNKGLKTIKYNAEKTVEVNVLKLIQ